MKTSMTALALAAALLTPGAWSLWAAHDIVNATAKRNERLQCSQDADRLRAELNPLQTDMQIKKAAADTLYADYSSRVNN